MSLFLFCKQILSHAISYSSNSFNFYGTFKFLAKILDMGVDRTIVEIVIISDNIFHKGFTLDNTLHISYEIFQNWKLGFCKLKLFSTKGCYMILCVDFNISKKYCFSIFYFFLFVSPFCYSSYASDKFTRWKWFCNIVISSELEQGHFIIFAFTSRKDYNRCFWDHSYFSANFDSIFPWKIDIKNDELWFFTSKVIECHKSIRTSSHGMTRLLKVYTKRSDDSLIIFYKKEMHNRWKIRNEWRKWSKTKHIVAIPKRKQG